jgi:hypothetical protein
MKKLFEAVNLVFALPVRVGTLVLWLVCAGMMVSACAEKPKEEKTLKLRPKSEQEMPQGQAEHNLQMLAIKKELLNHYIDRAEEMARDDWGSTGNFFYHFRAIPGTSARRLADELNRIGSLVYVPGQGSLAGSLAQSQSAEQLIRHLNSVQEYHNAMLRDGIKYYWEKYGDVPDLRSEGYLAFRSSVYASPRPWEVDPRPMEELSDTLIDSYPFQSYRYKGGDPYDFDSYELIEHRTYQPFIPEEPFELKLEPKPIEWADFVRKEEERKRRSK